MNNLSKSRNEKLEALNIKSFYTEDELPDRVIDLLYNREVDKGGMKGKSSKQDYSRKDDRLSKFGEDYVFSFLLMLTYFYNCF